MGKHYPNIGLIVVFILLNLSELRAEAKIVTFCGPEKLQCGSWQNHHSSESSLVGIRVQQYPDNECEMGGNLHQCFQKSRYTGRHPAMIIYVFSNCRIHQIGFESNGDMRENFWWRAEPGHWAIQEFAVDQKKCRNSKSKN